MNGHRMLKDGAGHGPGKQVRVNIRRAPFVAGRI